jgi:hypothetical protein
MRALGKDAGFEKPEFTLSAESLSGGYTGLPAAIPPPTLSVSFPKSLSLSIL